MSTIELRKFFACTESTNALIVLGVQANKTAAKFKKETVLELLSVTNTPVFNPILKHAKNPRSEQAHSGVYLRI